MPFILFENHCVGATVTWEGTITNFTAGQARDGRTNTQAGFSVVGNGIDWDFGESKTWDTLGIARHNFADAMDGVSDNVSIYGKVNSGDSWTLIKSDIVQASNDIYTTTFSPVTYRYAAVRFNFTNNLYVADISIGERLDLERAQRFGFQKPEFADSDQVISNVTKGQNLVGLSIKQQPKKVRYELFYYTANFYTRWLAMTAAMKSRPIYIKHDDNEKAFYCWPSRNMPAPKYSQNIQGYYDVDLLMEGITE